MSKIICDFCGAADTKANPIITGDNACICKSCVGAAYDIMNGEIILDETSNNSKKPKDVKIKTPAELKKILDEYIIGQDRAKKVLSVAVYNHYKRIFRKDELESDIELNKSNVLLIGPTGSGKTLLAQTISKYLDVPLAIADATSLTEAGYVGDDVENVVTRLVQAAGGDIEKAERGIIFIDEIDKIARMSENRSITRDVSGEGVQQALLKIVEGALVNIPPKGGRKHPSQELLQVDTSNILFICGGAFDGIEKIIGNRIGKKGLGFGAEVASKEKKKIGETLKSLLPEDLLKTGLIPEFVGRLPVIVTLDSLDEDALMSILVEPKNALVKQYKKMFEIDNVELEFKEDALRLIAQEALKRNTGARGLRSIIEAAMCNVMYEIPSRADVTKCTVTKEVILKKEEPVLCTVDIKAKKEESA